MFTIHSIFENDWHLQNKKVFLDYCYNAYHEKDEPSHVNMWDDDWEQNPATLPYLVYHSNRFKKDNGDVFALLKGEEIIALSGVNKSDFDPLVALGGVRTWVTKPYRGKFLVGRHLCPLQLAWAKDRNYKTLCLTFNEYNKRLIPYFKRSGLGIQKKRNPNSLFYNGQFHVDFACNINLTKQYVIYHKIDESYEPNWNSIKWTAP
jgi:hypothetical protein